MKRFGFLSLSGCILALTLALAGCESMGLEWPGASSEPAPAPAQTASSFDQVNFYYDFEDILIPRDMELVEKDSNVFETSQFRTGVMVFKGQVQAFSLVDFFSANMVKDGWERKTALKGDRSILVFEKPGKSCVIRIFSENIMYTRAEVQAVETKTGSASGMGSSQGGYSGYTSAPSPAAPQAPAPKAGRVKESTLSN